ncbi:TonB-linked SusC/RagA family outer membrane protein [Flavobacterium sp. 90]|uniref:SusC/RagA family TonB-linked outer membrane protein n=1 Tax=unclassified Flavobacterium TaxID=196869 RepID=UPI000EAFB523|nr:MULTISPECIES: SusC/RagA family TonB-linked outer membrane protein [unclassified Flavobacterium]RKR04598.1 TonB-linked SusC/RagA family outer membrane protein [Flavobacterium sp. 81]TCK55925.1 TonB-linked SusC/RagA family outer membrane protein [Flavobacterium sp. 90]
MMQKVFKLLFVFCLCSFQFAKAQTTVKGTITDAVSGIPIPGANVVVKGTRTSASSDFDGKYSIKVPNQSAVLVFSYVSSAPKEVAVGTQTTVNVALGAATQQLGEVVVTALGIKREKKAITYSAQNISVGELSEARSLNVANSLSGKVAGLNYSTTSNGVGSSSRITLRGNRSLTGNNQPMYVVDGVPISNGTTTGNPDIDTGGTTQPDGISNINPEDIASMTVLKGPSAAALYGTRASNGVIVITTKSGKSGKTSVSLSSNFMASSAYDLTNFQNEYGQGSQGVYNPTSVSSWGGKLDGSQVSAWQLVRNPNYKGPATTDYSPQPNNVMDFYKTGYNLANTLTITAGNEKAQGYFSYTNTKAEGIVGGNQLDRHNLNLRLTSKVSDKLSLDVKTNYIIQDIDNLLRTGEESIGTSAYLLPRSIKFNEYKNYEYTDAAGQLQQNYFVDEAGSPGGNPYWSALRDDSRKDKRNRFIGLASLKYDFTKTISLQVRTGLDQMTNKNVRNRYATVAFNNNLGSYSESYETVSEFNTDALLSYNEKFGDFSVGINAGANALQQNSSSLSSGGVLSKRNFFALSNVSTIQSVSTASEKRINSIYGFSQIGFRNYLFLDLTARNDWSSTLPAANRSFFYPSVGLSGVISDMVTLPEVISFAKLRASYAKVGNDTDPYQTSSRLSYIGGNGGMLYAQTTAANPNLRPEMSSSVEFGGEVRFLKNRLGLDVTYFQTNTKDQIFYINTPESSSTSRAVVNGGEIQNKGIEVVLTATPVQSEFFSWDVGVNFATYRSEVKSIYGGREELVLGEGRLVRSKVIQGGEYGDLYIKGFQRSPDGKIIVNSAGIPLATNSFDVRAGNFNPDWTAGLKNTFKYKDFSLSFLVDFRIGGEVISYTQAREAGLGVSDVTLPGRNGGIVVDGVVAGPGGTYTQNTVSINAEQYWTAIGQRTPIAEPFIYDATNIRLRELVFGYSLPKRVLYNSGFTSIDFSLVGRNLFFFENKAKYFDPEAGAGTGNLQGIESFNIPSTRDYGVNVKFGF